MSSEVELLKNSAYEAIDSIRTELHQVSKTIWSNPELCFQEKTAHDTLCTFLESKGFDVERHFILETAFRAQIGNLKDGPNVAVMCEYDALPLIGHGCGHNLIAEAGVAAAVGIQEAFKLSETPLGKLTILGSPAEEGGGGKVYLLEAGAFDDIDVAIIVHPTFRDALEIHYVATDWLFVRYEGKAVHAAVTPWEGQNALDAAVLAYQNISCLRQQMKPSCRVHGVIKNGGEKCNIIPETTELEFQVRAPRLKEMLVLKERVKSCFEAAATATGCKLIYKDTGKKHYADMIYNQPLVRAFAQNGKTLGVTYESGDFTASTDMGNVSQVVPAIHPHFRIGDEMVHSRGFTVDAGSDAAQPPTIKNGKILAATALDVYKNKDLLQEIKESFRKDMMDL